MAGEVGPQSTDAPPRPVLGQVPSAAIPTQAVPPPPGPVQAPAPAPSPAIAQPRVPASTKRRRHLGWILSGLALTLLAGLGALVVALSIVSEMSVLAASRPLEAGDIIAEGDLVEIRIPTRLNNIGTPATERDQLVGMEARSSISEGALVNVDQLVEPQANAFKDIVVGVALSPGQFPQIGLRPGEVVRVFELSNDNAGFGDVEVGQATEIGSAEVVRVTSLQQPDNFLYSLRVDANLAPMIADRASQGRIALGLLEGAGEPIDDDEIDVDALLGDEGSE